MEEVWKDVKGYEGLYQVSNLGRVKSLSRKSSLGRGYFRITKDRILKNNLNNTGYYRVNLKKDLKQKCHLVHRLVGIAFIDNPKNKRTINHINGIKTDNNISNLEWNTDLENITHSRDVLMNTYNMRKVLDTSTGLIYENLTSVLDLAGYSKGHMSAMLNGHYVNKTNFKYIE